LPFIKGNAGCEGGVQRFDTALHRNGERFQVTEFRRKSRAFKAGQKAEAPRKTELAYILSLGGKGNDP
jgi:hypothetical protein